MRYFIIGAVCLIGLLAGMAIWAKSSYNLPRPNEMHYMQDKRTNLCFLVGYRRLANVPCSKEVLELVIE